MCRKENIKFERITEGMLKENFGDWSKCESFGSDELKKIADAAYNTSVALGYDEPYLKWDSPEFYNMIESGKVIHMSVFYVRMKSEGTKKCPLCGGLILDESLVSISRRDSKTEICSDCGQKEAFADLLGIRV